MSSFENASPIISHKIKGSVFASKDSTRTLALEARTMLAEPSVHFRWIVPLRVAIRVKIVSIKRMIILWLIRVDLLVILIRVIRCITKRTLGEYYWILKIIGIWQITVIIRSNKLKSCTHGPVIVHYNVQIFAFGQVYVVIAVWRSPLSVLTLKWSVIVNYPKLFQRPWIEKLVMGDLRARSWHYIIAPSTCIGIRVLGIVLTWICSPIRCTPPSVKIFSVNKLFLWQ